MSSTGVLLVGALAVIAVLVVSAVIVAIAPYLAVMAVVSAICWFILRKSDDGQPPANDRSLDRSQDVSILPPPRLPTNRHPRD